jgi:hypothetical protein
MVSHRKNQEIPKKDNYQKTDQKLVKMVNIIIKQIRKEAKVEVIYKTMK